MSNKAPQHVQIGEYFRTVNEHGCVIEHSRWRASQLNEGRCCGRKTHPYKQALRLGPGTCCFKCNREYGLDGNQRPNHAFKSDGAGYYRRDEPLGLNPAPSHIPSRTEDR